MCVFVSLQASFNPAVPASRPVSVSQLCGSMCSWFLLVSVGSCWFCRLSLWFLLVFLGSCLFLKSARTNLNHMFVVADFSWFWLVLAGSVDSLWFLSLCGSLAACSGPGVLGSGFGLGRQLYFWLLVEVVLLSEADQVLVMVGPVSSVLSGVRSRKRGLCSVKIPALNKSWFISSVNWVVRKNPHSDWNKLFKIKLSSD